MQIPLLADIVIVLLMSVAVVYLFQRIRVPAVVGFLVSGVILGPHGLGLVQGIHEVEQLAEVGVILLLFTIGLEFSLQELLHMKRAVLLGGSVQVLGVLAAVFGGLTLAGVEPGQAFFLGLIATLSSTAVVLRMLQQRGEMESPQGRTALAVLIYQDLMVVPMMLVVPVLAGTGGGLGSALMGFGVKVVAILVGVVVLARLVVPALLERVVRTRSRDLFLLAVVSVCLVVAWAAAEAGLSLALGAFLAGLIVSESEYSHQALADVIPFRDLFAAFFFVSIGMFLDVGLAVGQPLLLAALVGGVLVLKAVVAGGVALVLGLPLGSAVLAGLALSQVGEFSFILAGSGLAEGILTEVAFEWFLVVAVMTMGLTPFIIGAGPAVAGAIQRLPLLSRSHAETSPAPAHGEDGAELRDHVVVVGYGVNGRNVTWAAGMAGIRHVVVDINPGLVQDYRAKGVPIHFGDASKGPVLEYLGVRRARAVVVAVADAAATRAITAQARALAPGCYIIARTRYTAEVEPLMEAGADLVIPEELETSVEIVSRLLRHYLVPQREVDAFLTEVRSGGYEMLRSLALADASLADLSLTLADVEISTLIVAEDSAVSGKALRETDLRRVYGVTVVAIRRGDELIPNPGPEARIESGDALIVLGIADEIAAASALLEGVDPDTEGP